MDRWDRAGRLAGYAAALAMTPYLVIKVSWVVGSLAGPTPTGTGLSTGEWVAINTATIGMAGVAIVMALALVMPWGMRLPGPPLAFCAWVGTGFLVPMLPYAVLTSLVVTSTGDGGSADTGWAMPGWEAALIQIGFVGMGVGLAVALPAYLRRRWPNALAGRLGDRERATAQSLGWAVPLGVAVAVVWVFWAAGGTAGLAEPGDLDRRLLAGVTGAWAVVAAAATWMVTKGRPGRLGRGGPMVLGWLGSGSLFAWSAWKLVLTAYVAVAGPAGGTPPIRLDVAIALHSAGVLAGAAMGWTLVRSRSPRLEPRRLHAQV
ncbi:MAG: hypothetical protein ACRDO0_05335 [Nocardioidaceae bacterium]